MDSNTQQTFAAEGEVNVATMQAAIRALANPTGGVNMSTATVTATKESLLLYVSPTAFQNFLQMVTPEVRNEIKETICSRAKAMLSDTVSDLVDPKNVALSSDLK